MKLNQLLYQRGDETVRVEHDPSIPRGTIRVGDVPWFMAVVDSDTPPAAPAPVRRGQGRPRGSGKKVTKKVYRTTARGTKLVDVTPTSGKQRLSSTMIAHRTGEHTPRLGRLGVKFEDLQTIAKAVRERDLRLTPQQLNVLRLRFGVDTEPLTATEIYQKLNMGTHARVSEMTMRGLKALGIRRQRFRRDYKGSRGNNL